MPTAIDLPKEPFSFEAPAPAQVITRAVNIPGGKVKDTHVSGSRTLTEVAYWYARDYRGTFDYMQDMSRKANKGIRLTPAQLAGILNCMIAEAKRAAKAAQSPAQPATEQEPPHYGAAAPEPTQAPQSGARAALARVNETPELAALSAAPAPQSTEPVIKDGTYTVVLNQEGEYRTLRIRTIPDEERASLKLPKGAQKAAFLSGSDNERDFTNFAFVIGGTGKIYKSYKQDQAITQALFILLKANAEEQADLGHAYALASGRCYRCGKALTVPASINRGLGPDCAEKM